MQDFAPAKKFFPVSRRLFAPFVLFFALGCFGPPPKHPTWNNATGGEQHERLIWQAIGKKDWTAVERHLSPTFVGVNARGEILDRTGWIAYWKSAPPGEVSLGELAVQPEGPDMKVTSIIHFPGGSDKDSSAGGFRVVSIWQEVKAHWALTATSITPIQNN